jgi:hypothetical protein
VTPGRLGRGAATAGASGGSGSTAAEGQKHVGHDCSHTTQWFVRMPAAQRSCCARTLAWQRLVSAREDAAALDCEARMMLISHQLCMMAQRLVRHRWAEQQLACRLGHRSSRLAHSWVRRSRRLVLQLSAVGRQGGWKAGQQVLVAVLGLHAATIIHHQSARLHHLSVAIYTCPASWMVCCLLDRAKCITSVSAQSGRHHFCAIAAAGSLQARADCSRRVSMTQRCGHRSN